MEAVDALWKLSSLRRMIASALELVLTDLLRLQRLKKRKLLLRDRIAFIEDQITPDIIA